MEFVENKNSMLKLLVAFVIWTIQYCIWVEDAALIRVHSSDMVWEDKKHFKHDSFMKCYYHSET